MNIQEKIAAAKAEVCRTGEVYWNSTTQMGPKRRAEWDKAKDVLRVLQGEVVA